MNTFEERYGVEEGEAVKHYHRIRRMFCIKDDVLYIAKPNVEYSHAVWFEMNGWSDDVKNTAVRGVVDPHGNIYYYVGYDFQIDDDSEKVFFTHLDDLVEQLKIKPTALIFGGKVKSDSSSTWPPRTEYGVVKDYI